MAAALLAETGVPAAAEAPVVSEQLDRDRQRRDALEERADLVFARMTFGARGGSDGRYSTHSA